MKTINKRKYLLKSKKKKKINIYRYFFANKIKEDIKETDQI